jgi:hypothetical protein
MEPFSGDKFALRLIAESLFFDAEYDALGTLSLVDPVSAREMVIASFSPEDEMFVVEEATEWEQYEPGQEDDIGYALAVDSRELGSFDSAQESATMILELARKSNLVPSVTMLFGEEEVS